MFWVPDQDLERLRTSAAAEAVAAAAAAVEAEITAAANAAAAAAATAAKAKRRIPSTQGPSDTQPQRKKPRHGKTDNHDGKSVCLFSFFICIFAVISRGYVCRVVLCGLSIIFFRSFVYHLFYFFPSPFFH